jgi:hypothetical protein
MELVDVVFELLADDFVVLHGEVEFVAINGELGTAFLNARLKACFVERRLGLYDSANV